MTFKVFADAVHQRLATLTAQHQYFFKAGTEDLFQIYLSSFPEGADPIFRERRVHDCQCCKQFIRNLGSLVAIKDGKILTVWQELGELPHPYDVVAAALDSRVQSAGIASIFATKELNFGTASNRDNHDPSIVWNHFHGAAPLSCVVANPGEKIGRQAAAFSVGKRGLSEISLEAIDAVLDLINDNGLYRGAEFKKGLAGFRALKVAYSKASSDLLVWEHLHSPSLCIRNTVIGTLLTDLSEGKPEEDAVRAFEAKVAPESYKRPTAVVTGRMIENAVAKIRDLGLEEAISRRFARLEDISVNDVIFVDNHVASRTRDGLVDLLMPEAAGTHRRQLSGSEISIDEFIGLGANKIELVLEGQHLSNFVSLTAPVGEDRGLFSWGNSFGWSYDGNFTDSVKERVKQAGGSVDALFRCSLSWFNRDDLDLHCQTPAGGKIYFGNKQGILDVDMNASSYGLRRDAVENMAFRSVADGTYIFGVHNFCRRESTNVGFNLQVEFNGRIFDYAHAGGVSDKSKVRCLEVTFKNGELVEIKTGSGVSGGAEISREKWGVKTNSPVRVNLLMLSPNHWESAKKTGNKHWFFILDGCTNPEPVRGIYNEFLSPALLEHRKVFEILGGKTKCQPCQAQLSGVGFSETKKEAVTALADGRPYRVHF
jgi:hypothetical protein